MKKNTNSISLLHILYYVAVILFFFMIVRGFVISNTQIRHISYDEKDPAASYVLTSLNDNWTLTHENGETEAVSLPLEIPATESEITISRKVSGLFRPGDMIKFDNNRQGISVLANDEIIYEVNTTSLTDQLSFTDYQLVVISDPENVSELSLKLSHTVYDSFYLPEIHYGSYNSAVNEIIRDDIVTLSILVILLLFLFITTLVFIYCKINNLSEHRVMDLGIFIIAAILWGFTDSYLAILSSIPQEVLGLICYLSLMVLPIPMCHFAWISCKGNDRTFRVITTMGVLNLILQSLFSFLGIIHLENTFFIAHIVIVIVIITSLYCIYQARKTTAQKEMNILYVGLSLLAVIALLSIYLYWVIGGIYYRICMMAGILIFSCFLFGYVVVHYVRRMQEDKIRMSEVRIQERMSYYDVLTGIPNRRAFEVKMQEIEAQADTLEDAVLIMMDVNGLKRVNDQFGHLAGDDLIVAASGVITKTYGAHGDCYRIGGDEFVVILLDFSIPLSHYDDEFDQNIEAYNKNSRWKLSIAKGVSHLLHSTEPVQRLTLSDWKQEADVNMYRDKLSKSRLDSRTHARDLTDIINCIISTVEAKDMNTAAHSERVRELSYVIASKLGVSESTLTTIQLAAHLHDIGKVGISDYILLKPGRLTDEEYEEIKKHCAIGANIIGQAKGMAEIADIIMHHHERWDGKGYPEGLVADQIPLESRIIALADSIDAITSKRVYRDGMSLDVCRAEIEKNSAVMYDPAITQIVLQNWQDIVDIVMLHPKRLVVERN